MDLQLTQEQKSALETIVDWYKKPSRPFLTLGGYAGTGKSTLTAVLRQRLHAEDEKLRIAFCSYTGKASQVLKGKLAEQKAQYKQDSVSTIHSLIYEPILDSSGEVSGWQKKEQLNVGLIIVDEASMLEEKIWHDLLSFKIPILAIGDHGQLPPINGRFNLMQKPMLTLEKIFRQAEDNPIIALAQQARTQGVIEPGNYGYGVRKVGRDNFDYNNMIQEELDNYNSETLFLTAHNWVRIRLNKAIRNNIGFFGEEPQSGDRVICLRNSRKKQIYNGMLGTIEQTFEIEGQEDWLDSEIMFDDEGRRVKVPIYLPQFHEKTTVDFSRSKHEYLKEGQLFDFGYAITVHKAQGSQAPKVVLFEKRMSRMDDEMWRRWLYTAVTRAQEELVIFEM